MILNNIWNARCCYGVYLSDMLYVLIWRKARKVYSLIMKITGAMNLVDFLGTSTEFEYLDVFLSYQLSAYGKNFCQCTKNNLTM